METKLFFQQNHKKCKLFKVALVSDCFGYMYSVGLYSINTSNRRQSKTLILSTSVDLRSFKKEIMIAVCRPTVNYSYSSPCFGVVLRRIQ